LTEHAASRDRRGVTTVADVHRIVSQWRRGSKTEASAAIVAFGPTEVRARELWSGLVRAVERIEAAELLETKFGWTNARIVDATRATKASAALLAVDAELARDHVGVAIELPPGPTIVRSRAASPKCEHGHRGSVRHERFRPWNARRVVKIGARTLNVCKSCANDLIRDAQDRGTGQFTTTSTTSTK
jgi:hypothetical protein